MKLPNGQFVFFGNVPWESTAADVQAYLFEAGIEVGLERISMRNHPDDFRASAVVSLPGSEIASLVARAIFERPLLGRVLRVSCPGVKSDLSQGRT